MLAAAEAAGVAAETVNYHRRNDPVFAQACAEAIDAGYQMLDALTLERAEPFYPQPRAGGTPSAWFTRRRPGSSPGQAPARRRGEVQGKVVSQFEIRR
jgi:hypothetical protein